MRVHPDIYPTLLSGFLTYDGVTMPQSHEWTDAHIPRTERPLVFSYAKGRTAPMDCGNGWDVGIYPRPDRLTQAFWSLFA